MTSVNVTENKYSVSVAEGATTVVTVKAPGPQGIQGIQGATGAGISAGDKGSLTVAANLTDWTLNDSVVTNAKVASDAAIAGSKISPDFGSQNITTTGNAVFGGNLTVSGTTTTIDTTTLRVEDKNIELGKVGSPTDITADGGGITLKGATDKTFNWLDATDSWTSSEHIALPDNKKLQLGDSQDLQLFHDGSQSIIADVGTGQLAIRGGTTVSISNAAGTQVMANFINGGACNLFHAGNTKLTTTASGVTVSGNFFAGNLNAALDGNTSISLEDTGHGLPASEIKLSNGGRDLNIVAPKDIRLFTQQGENAIVMEANAQVELYFNALKKAETSSTGFDVTGTLKAINKVNIHDNGTSTPMLQLTNSVTGSGTEDGFRIGYSTNSNVAFFIAGESNSAFQIKTGGSAANDERLNISNTGVFTVKSNSENMLVATPNAGVELYHNNVKRCETSADGLDLPDNSKLQLGDSQDLQLFHDGTQSIIQDNGTGGLRLRGENTISLANANGSKVYARFVTDDTAQLYHNNVVRLSTTGIGVTVSGKLTSTGDIIINSDYPVLSFLDTNNDSDYRLTNANGNFLLFDISNAATRFTVTNAGLLKVHGNVEPEADNTRALGSSSKRFTTLHANSVKASTGILFGSDTADANTLDDYEEGTWTPTVLSEGNIGTPQITCTYTKIGRLVTINADIHQLSDTTSSTHIKIGGLPYVPSGTAGKEHSAVCHGERYGGSDIIVAYLLYNSGSYGISFRFGVPSGHYSAVKHSDISDDGTDNNLRFTLTYELA